MAWSMLVLGINAVTVVTAGAAVLLLQPLPTHQEQALRL
jgi:hypothetical protein